MQMINKLFGGCIFVLTLFCACGSKEDKLPTDLIEIPGTAEKGLDRSNLPDIKFEEEEFDFGTITQGEKVVHDFKFENTGNRELIISNAYADCGCTVPEVPKKPIAPGEESMIRVSFDSDRKSGIVSKTISVVTNCIPNKKVVKIKATIFVPQSKSN